MRLSGRILEDIAQEIGLDMTKMWSHGLFLDLRPVPGFAALAALLMLAATPGLAADPAEPYILKVESPSAKVGERASLVATVTLTDGYRFLESYNNRLIKLSSFDDGVAFEREVVPGSLKDGGLVFVVPVTSTKPGDHPINGLVRIGYAEGTTSMKMISVPLMAKVTGTE